MTVSKINWRIAFAMLLSMVLLSGCHYEEMGPWSVSGTSVYKLGPGDKLRVIVFDQAELNNEYSVDSAGRVSIPLVGNIRVSGRTTHQVEHIIIARLRDKEIVKDPKVAVEVTKYRSFYVLGEVNRSGHYEFSNGMTVEKAVAVSGGFTIHADKHHFRVSRLENGEIVTHNAAPYDLVRPGDTIFVRERWF